MPYDPENGHKPAGQKVKQRVGHIDRTVKVSGRNIDMLESAICQLLEREPKFWWETAAVFAREARLERTLRYMKEVERRDKERQVSFS